MGLGCVASGGGVDWQAGRVAETQSSGGAGAHSVAELSIDLGPEVRGVFSSKCAKN